MPSHFRVKALVVAIGMATAMSVNAASVSLPASNGFVALNQQATVLSQGDVVSGAVDASQPMHIEVALKLRNKTQLQSFIRTARSSPLSVIQRKMTAQQFAASYSPTHDQGNKDRQQQREAP